MERIEEVPSVELLRNANDHFRNFFARFAGLPVEGSEEELRAMLQIESILRSVGALLASGMTTSKSAGLHGELSEYRENLLRLRDELRRMESSAEGRQERLLAREQHLRATRAWCAAARATR